MEMRFEDGLVDEALTQSAVYNDIMRSVEITYGDFGHGCVKMTFKGICCMKNVESTACCLQMHKMKPDYILSITGILLCNNSSDVSKFSFLICN